MLAGFQSLNPDCRGNLLKLFIAGLLFWASLTTLLPTLPLYIQSLGGTAGDIGIVMGSFAIGLLCCRPLLGRVADRRGRKLVLLIGTTSVALSPVGYLGVQLLASAHNAEALPEACSQTWCWSTFASAVQPYLLSLMIALRAFHGISVAAFALAFLAIVVDLTPVHVRGEILGYMTLVNPVGLALGPAIGGFIQAAYGYVPLFLVSAVLGGAGFLCAASVQESPPLPTTDRNPEQGHYWRLLLQPAFYVPSVVLLMIGVAFGTLGTFIPLLIQSTGVPLNPGLFYTAAAIASFTSRIVVGRASDRWGRGVFLSLSQLFFGIAMLILVVADSTPAFLLAGAVEGFGFGMLIPMMAALIADRSQPAARGRTFSLCIAGFDLGIACAGPILGLVADSLGYRLIFMSAAGLVFVGLVVFVTQCNPSLHKSIGFALGRSRDTYAVDLPSAA
ncbi:MAG: MFS transporter, partial [Cyanobacteria bacterium P01_H01_bin.121]